MSEQRKIRVQQNNLTIRSAEVTDAELLTTWWNDGTVMEHAGFPNGLNQSLQETIEQIKSNEHRISQLCVIEVSSVSIGELSYNLGDRFAEIGIKICNSSYQNQGLGKKFLEMLIDFLFNNEELNHAVPIDKITLDTNLKNERAQHVYEQIGFMKVRVNVDAWEDQIGQKQSGVDYEMTKERYRLCRKEWL